MGKVKVAALQLNCTKDPTENIAKAEELIRTASKAGAKIILLSELFGNPYFCQTEDPQAFKLAKPLSENLAIARFSLLARELDIVLPISFFERVDNRYFNSLIVIDSDGKILESYRKTHLADYKLQKETFYFEPGDTGFKVWQTHYGKIGVGLSFDAFFPESARIMTEMGAELLLYPTAVSAEVLAPLDKSWVQQVVAGQAASNLIPIVISNRVGKEGRLNFCGESFITDSSGKILQKANATKEEIVLSQLDLTKSNQIRENWQQTVSRRPAMYHTLTK